MNNDGLHRAMFAQPVVELAVNYDAQGKPLSDILGFLAPPIQFPKPQTDFDALCTDYDKKLSL